MKWTITVEASSGSVDETPATITAVMQSSADEAPRIVELVVRASEEGGIPPRAALDIDFEMLAQAVSGVAAPGAASPVRKAPEGPKAPAPAADEHSERPYRKMPDAEEVTEVFLETRSVGKVAQHYEVPRYTAQSWIDRLRRLGYVNESKSGASSRRGRG
ncbi:hypothetical protein [Streptomyces violens]|uniref:hypothetical protein n=1 Tax=Streptomyces violens TaxID=66377 RepID=UPI0007C81BF8|nr:hypothetical protein [Streptomyces violens]